MKLNYKTALFTLSLLLTGSSAAIAQQPQIPQVNEQVNEKAKQKPVDPSHVMAVIDGKPLTAGTVDEWAKIISPGPDETVEQRRLQTLRALVGLKAFAGAAQGEKLDETDDFKKRMAIMKESTLQQMYVDTKIMFPVSDGELKARYEKEIGALPKEPEIHARHILVKTREEAAGLIRRLNAGEDFEKLAKEKSTDGSASLGGDLGYFTRGQMVKPFEDVAFGLKKGEYTKAPVETPFGWHIIKVEDVRKKEPPSLEDAKLYIQNMIIRERYDGLQKRVLSTLKVSYPDEAVARAMQQPVPDEESQDEFEDQ